ncbi:sigma-70 family RNA polymerase sigma factor [Ottowia thiooxydans]|uniref:sigma-70 family RNA polymerase sigma factor n=1 Tax=Ottowia thiooxydans TaxID=219182 RepID=UPI00048C5C1D|nr:sigma-70 family RNA polymerase sigma factor [Ottowia thiooxydans]
MQAAESSLNQEVHSLYLNHHSWLYRWLWKRLGNSFDAADLAHDTFTRLLTRDAPIAAQEPRAFLTTVAQGVVSNFHRRRKVEAAYFETLAGLPEPQVPCLETRAILLETLIEIDRRLDGLKMPVRQAFLLSQLDGLTQPQIAAELGVSLATVQRYIAKAVQQCFFGAERN